jgi:EAL domain-containing protein (putative c-di-GMP-specific phosphodiesterase class I)
MGLAVNLSPLHFRHPALLDTVRQAIGRHRLPEYSLELELTEGMLMDELDETLGILGQLKRAGVRLAIDDFGTGYSSLSYLTRFPIDVLKIDRSFIRGITHDASQMNITRAIIAMAHGLKLDVVAEGVETREQAELLHRESCDLIQGYLYGRPMPAEDFTQRLADQAG